MDALDMFYEKLDRLEEEFEHDGEEFIVELQQHLTQCALGNPEQSIACE